MINNKKILLIPFFFIIVSFEFYLVKPSFPVSAMKYVPPQQQEAPPAPPQKEEVPVPIPEPDESKNDNPPGPQPTDEPGPPPPTPTPTPCYPDWCFIQKTACCFNPICIFLGQTAKDSGSRCDNSSTTNLKYFTQSSNPSLSLFGKIALFFQSLLNPFNR